MAEEAQYRPPTNRELLAAFLLDSLMKVAKKSYANWEFSEEDVGEVLGAEAVYYSVHYKNYVDKLERIAFKSSKQGASYSPQENVAGMIQFLQEHPIVRKVGTLDSLVSWSDLGAILIKVREVASDCVANHTPKDFSTIVTWTLNLLECVPLLAGWKGILYQHSLLKLQSNTHEEKGKEGWKPSGSKKRNSKVIPKEFRNTNREFQALACLSPPHTRDDPGVAEHLPGQQAAAQQAIAQQAPAQQAAAQLAPAQNPPAQLRPAGPAPAQQVLVQQVHAQQEPVHPALAYHVPMQGGAARHPNSFSHLQSNPYSPTGTQPPSLTLRPPERQGITQQQTHRRAASTAGRGRGRDRADIQSRRAKSSAPAGNDLRDHLHMALKLYESQAKKEESLKKECLTEEDILEKEFNEHLDHAIAVTDWTAEDATASYRAAQERENAPAKKERREQELINQLSETSFQLTDVSNHYAAGQIDEAEEERRTQELIDRMVAINLELDGLNAQVPVAGESEAALMQRMDVLKRYTSATRRKLCCQIRTEIEMLCDKQTITIGQMNKLVARLVTMMERLDEDDLQGSNAGNQPTQRQTQRAPQTYADFMTQIEPMRRVSATLPVECIPNFLARCAKIMDDAERKCLTKHVSHKELQQIKAAIRVLEIFVAKRLPARLQRRFYKPSDTSVSEMNTVKNPQRHHDQPYPLVGCMCGAVPGPIPHPNPQYTRKMSWCPSCKTVQCSKCGDQFHKLKDCVDHDAQESDHKADSTEVMTEHSNRPIGTVSIAPPHDPRIVLFDCDGKCGATRAKAFKVCQYVSKCMPCQRYRCLVCSKFIARGDMHSHLDTSHNVRAMEPVSEEAVRDHRRCRPQN